MDIIAPIIPALCGACPSYNKATTRCQRALSPVHALDQPPKWCPIRAEQPVPPPVSSDPPTEKPKKCMHCPFFESTDGGHFGVCVKSSRKETQWASTPDWCPLPPHYKEAIRHDIDPKVLADIVTLPPSLTPRTPKHYAGTVTPWDLERCMVSSGNAFVDSRRTDAIEYCYRMKGNLLQDLLKAKHCIEAAIEELEKEQNTTT